MKVLINYLIEGELGRTTWVTRQPEGLAFGTIYVHEKDAADLTLDELNYLLDNQGFKYLVSKVV